MVSTTKHVRHLIVFGDSVFGLMFCYVLLGVPSSFAIIFEWKRELIALFELPSLWIATVSALWVLWVGLLCLIVLFSDHNHLRFATQMCS